MTPEEYTKKKKALYNKQYYLDHLKERRAYAAVKNRAKAELKLNAIKEVLDIKFRTIMFNNQTSYWVDNATVVIQWNMEGFYKTIAELIDSSIEVLKPQRNQRKEGK